MTQCWACLWLHVWNLFFRQPNIMYGIGWMNNDHYWFEKIQPPSHMDLQMLFFFQKKYTISEAFFKDAYHSKTWQKRLCNAVWFLDISNSSLSPQRKFGERRIYEYNINLQYQHIKMKPCTVRHDCGVQINLQFQQLKR